MKQKEYEILPLSLILSHFWGQVVKYKWGFLLPFIGYAISNVLIGTFKPLLYKGMVDFFESAVRGDVPKEGAMQFVMWLVVLLIIANIIHTIFDYIFVYAQSNIIKEANDYSFDGLHRHSYKFLINNFQGSLVTKARRYPRSYEGIHDRATFSLWRALLQFISIFMVLFITAFWVGIFFAAWCVFFMTVTVFLIQKKRRYDLAVANADSRTTGALADSITGALNIKTFAALPNERERFANITSEEERIRRAAWNFNNFVHIVHRVMWLILEIGGIYLIVKFWINGSVTFGTVVMLQTYFVMIQSIMWDLRSSLGDIVKLLSDASEMVEITEQEPDILDPKHAEECTIKNGKIEFDDVSFAYDEGAAVFSGFNLTLESGDRVGLVGYSGSGKTTITNILLRFMDILSGKVLIDEQDISKIRQDDLRRNISYVSQDPILFHRSLYENIAYAKSDATNEEIIDAARKANAHDFIIGLSEGYDTLVGERGVKLSGGERQRVAIARAMLKDAPILVLDEATSSLDSISEKSVQKAFERLMENRTTIVIAHRLSTIRQMDRIIVLDTGKVVEEGSHNTLLGEKGLYHDLWMHQSGGFIG